MWIFLSHQQSRWQSRERKATQKSYGKSRAKLKQILTFLLLSFFTVFAQEVFASSVEKSGSPGKNSISVQVGINGILQKTETYSIQAIPPDVSYSYEFFDNNNVNISTSTFYDNIGVNILDTNFTYRVGQRIDIGFELERFTPYITCGLGVIRNAHHYQTSPVIGVGFLTKIAKKLALINEVNFQRVYYQNSGYEILNASVGLVYNF